MPTLDDIEHVFSATRYVGFNDGMLWDPPQSMDELLEPYQRTVKSWESGTAYTFTIKDRVTNEFLGRISIRQTPISNHWNMGFWTHPKH